MIEDVKEIEEIEIKADKEDDEFIEYETGYFYINHGDKIIINKINELVQAVNQIRKERKAYE